MKKEKTTVSVGGLWVEQTERGAEKFSIALDVDALPPPDKKGRIRLTAMPNKFKDEQKEGAPDYNVFYGVRPLGGLQQEDSRRAPAQRPQRGGYEKRY